MRIEKFKKSDIYINATGRTPEDIKEKRCEICTNAYNNYSAKSAGTYLHCKLISHKQYETISCKGCCDYYGMTLAEARENEKKAAVEPVTVVEAEAAEGYEVPKLRKVFKGR